MATVSTNTTIALDGVTAINIGGVDEFIWSGEWLDGVFLYSGTAGVTATLDASGDWGSSVIAATGLLRVVLNDDAVAGTRSLDALLLAEADDLVELSRTDINHIDLGGGNNQLTVGDVKLGSIVAGYGNDSVTVNSTEWIDRIDLGHGDNDLTMTANIGGVAQVTSYSGADIINVYTDAGMITTGGGNDIIDTDSQWVHSVDAGSGDDVITICSNARSIGGGSGADQISIDSWAWIHLVDGGSGDDVIRVEGEADLVDGGFGNDLIVTGSQWVGSIDSGDGEDRVVLGSCYNDYVDLGKDSDILIVTQQEHVGSLIVANGGDWTSSLPGSADWDTVKFSGLTTGVRVSLAGEFARSDQATMKLIDFEKVVGARGRDVLIGDDQVNTLVGRGGRDVLIGGEGRDRLVGGAGADRFRFVTIEADRDRIVDFNQSQNDRIDLRRLDADILSSGDQEFTFLGNGSFEGNAGDLRVVSFANRVRVDLDVDGDRSADMHILLMADQPLELVETDFLL